MSEPSGRGYRIEDTALSACSRFSIMGNMTPNAPTSSACFTTELIISAPFWGTRTEGRDSHLEVAVRRGPLPVRHVEEEDPQRLATPRTVLHVDDDEVQAGPGKGAGIVERPV